MRKIGLYLSSDSSSGGAFQYGLTVLDAVAALQGKDYDVLVAYSSTSWARVLKEYDVVTFHVPIRAYDRDVALWWRRFDLPTGFWRNIARSIYSFTRRFMQANRDLWIFASQYIWLYRLSVPALCSIHDLMHRYERRFAEVSKYGRYRRREAHYRDIGRWLKGILVDSSVVSNRLLKVLVCSLTRYMYYPLCLRNILTQIRCLSDLIYVTPFLKNSFFIRPGSGLIKITLI